MTRRLRGAALVFAMVVLVAAAHFGSGSSGHDHGRMPTAVRTSDAAATPSARVVLAEARVASLGPPAAARAEPVAAPAATLAPPPPRPYLGRFLVTCYALRGTTKSGRQVAHDLVAVDPGVVPLGTRVGIAGVGPRLAADTGRLIRGRHLDIWMPSRQACVEFGRKHLDVYLIP